MVEVTVSSRTRSVQNSSRKSVKYRQFCHPTRRGQLDRLLLNFAVADIYRTTIRYEVHCNLISPKTPRLETSQLRLPTMAMTPRIPLEAWQGIM